MIRTGVWHVTSGKNTASRQQKYKKFACQGVKVTKYFELR